MFTYKQKDNSIFEQAQGHIAINLVWLGPTAAYLLYLLLTLLNDNRLKIVNKNQGIKLLKNRQNGMPAKVFYLQLVLKPIEKGFTSPPLMV